MNRLEKVLSRPVAKPYRSHKFSSEAPCVDDDGNIAFAEDDIENPKNWSTGRRTYITVVCISLVLNATFASSMPSGCLQSISQEFDVSTTVGGLVITLFLLGYCFGPLFFAPLSEYYGRRWIFYGTFILYIAFNFLCAWAPNFPALLVGRFLTGTFASAPLSNAPGVIADLWGPIERGNAMALFSFLTFAGPGISPAIAGFLELTKGWRWSFYVLLWLGAITLAFLFTIPETLQARVLTNKARRVRNLKVSGYENIQSPQEASNQSLGQIFKVALTRPWIILFDTISFLVAIYITVTYLLLYMLFTVYPIVFRQQRGWNAGVSELPLIGTVCGAGLGSIIIFINSKQQAKNLRAGRKMVPEDRLVLSMIGGIGFTVSMFWLGWSANFLSVHWFVPTLAGVFLAMSIVLIFVSFLNYLTDSYLMYAASAIAANTVVRSAAAASAPLWTASMFNSLGVGVASSVIGGVAALLAVVPFVFYKYGSVIRKRSRFAPTPAKDDEEATEQSGETQQNDDSPGSPSSSSTTLEEERLQTRDLNEKH